MNGASLSPSAQNETAMTPYIIRVVLYNFASLLDCASYLSGGNQPLRFGHLSNCMRQEKDPLGRSPSYAFKNRSNFLIHHYLSRLSVQSNILISALNSA